jgi:ketosteroid isomerase-like protein
MRRNVIAILVLAFFLPLTVQAQQWNAEQQEVWDVVEACFDTQDTEDLMACYHDDFVGWGLGNGVPVNKADKRAINARVLESSDNVWQHLKPLSIEVRGDVAIVLYVFSFVERNKATGEETTGTVNWTDIMVLVDDRWLWLADHGTRVEGN